MYKVFVSILIVIVTYCNSEDPIPNDYISNALDFYKNYSQYTDPGDYTDQFTSLPDSLTGLCDLIKCQFIHPVDLDPYRHLFPSKKYYEDPQFPTVQDLITGLLDLDSNGLTFDRKPENRLIVTCRYHSIFLASILKFRGIPARVRYGFAPYLSKNRDRHICHVICEVWNKTEQRWMFVDPDRKMVDFSRDEFELGGDAWLKYQRGGIDNPNKYGVASSWGKYHILDMLCHDFASILGDELLYWERPPISDDDSMNIDGLESAKKDVLDKISNLLKDPDLNLNELMDIYDNKDYLQFHR